MATGLAAWIDCFSIKENVYEGSIMSENGALDMTVSPICVRDGKKMAFVRFTDGARSAEGVIPQCDITENKGFTTEEVSKLEDYMKAELATLKKMAANVNVMKAFMGDKQ